MTQLSELGFFDWCWLTLFLIITGPLTWLGIIIVGGDLKAIGLLVGVLSISAGSLLLVISKWQNWLLRLLLTASITGFWFVVTGSIWQHFKDFC